MRPAGRRAGFTLIELAIVLVIIGLVVGGVLVGRDLIYASRLRALGKQMQEINTAITSFRGKYDGIPGDLPNATLFFGTNSSGCPNGGGTSGTCDGNGNGHVNHYFSAGNLEHIYAWHHLALSGMYTWPLRATSMRGGTGGISLVVGQNTPPTNFHDGIGYSFYSVRANNARYGRKTIEIGAPGSVNADVLCGAGLSAPQAMALDMKFDDGMPESGKMYIVSGGSSIGAINTIATQASSINANTTCVSAGAYLTSDTTGCTVEYTPDTP